MALSSSSSEDLLDSCFSETSSDSPSHALTTTPSDAVFIYSGPDSCPSFPPVGYTAIFSEVRGVGFHQNLSWIMVELCSLLRIAPSQLTLRSWGLIHALQVLSDLSAVEITGSMVATAFRTREIGEGSRRFELLPRPRCRSPVKLPEWIENTTTSGEYFFVRHLGPRPDGFRHSWSPLGIYIPLSRKK